MGNKSFIKLLKIFGFLFSYLENIYFFVNVVRPIFFPSIRDDEQ